MTRKKLDTIDLKGKDYAQVAERIRQFREDNPKGLIETEPIIKKDNSILFKARVIKDKSNNESAEATGHSWGKNIGTKALEKLETIAIGRALASLGYLASGEVASFEEMEDFYKYREQKIEEAIDKINDSKSISQLKKIFMNLDGLISDERIIKAKDTKKKELQEKESK